MTEKDQRNRSVEKTVRDIRRATRRQYSAEEKIRIVLEGLRGEESIAELCRREGINTNIYYDGQRNFWKLGRGAWPGILLVRLLRMKSRIYAARPVRSKKPWQSY